MPSIRTAISGLTALSGLAALVASAGLAFAQQPRNTATAPAAAPATGAKSASSPSITFRTVVFSRAPQDEAADTVVSADPTQPLVRTGGQLQSRQRLYEEDSDFNIRTDLPGPERLFDTRKSEEMMREYIRRETQVRTGANRILFPEYTPLSRETYTGRSFPQQSTQVLPNIVCHGRLYFEQTNFDRLGWDLGYLTVPVSYGVFLYDVAALPYHSGIDPCRHYECNHGKCLPGDATPLFLYREPFSLTGAVMQGAAIGTGFIAFP